MQTIVFLLALTASRVSCPFFSVCCYTLRFFWNSCNSVSYIDSHSLFSILTIKKTDLHLSAFEVYHNLCSKQSKPAFLRTLRYSWNFFCGNFESLNIAKRYFNMSYIVLISTCFLFTSYTIKFVNNSNAKVQFIFCKTILFTHCLKSLTTISLKTAPHIFHTTPKYTQRYNILYYLWIFTNFFIYKRI